MKYSEDRTRAYRTEEEKREIIMRVLNAVAREGVTIKEAAARDGVSVWGFHHWKKALFGTNSTKEIRKRLSIEDEETLRTLAIEARGTGKSVAEIAVDLEIPEARVKRFLNWHAPAPPVHVPPPVVSSAVARRDSLVVPVAEVIEIAGRILPGMTELLRLRLENALIRAATRERGMK